MTLHCFQVIVTNAQSLSSAEDYPLTIIIFSAGLKGCKPDLITVHQNYAGKEITNRDLIVIWKIILIVWYAQAFVFLVLVFVVIVVVLVI